MKDSHLINYNLFCQRTKFSLYTFLKQRPDTSYEELCTFLRNRRVTPVSQDIYKSCIDKVLLEIVPEPVLEEVVEVKVEENPKNRRRRTRRKKSDE